MQLYNIMNCIKSSIIPFAVCCYFSEGWKGGQGSFILSIIIIMFNLVLMTLAPKQVLLLLNCMTTKKKKKNLDVRIDVSFKFF